VEPTFACSDAPVLKIICMSAFLVENLARPFILKVERRHSRSGNDEMALTIRLVGGFVGLAVFGVWMGVVGNPHVAETMIGLVLSAIAGTWTWWQLRKVVGRRVQPAARGAPARE
jgi:hypothetical protein